MTQVHDVREYNGEKVAIRHCAGGTCANPVVEYANENRGKFDCFINFTDGYVGSVDVKSLLPTLWLINTGGTVDIAGLHNKRAIIKMNHGQS